MLIVKLLEGEIWGKGLESGPVEQRGAGARAVELLGEVLRVGWAVELLGELLDGGRPRAGRWHQKGVS